MVPDQDVEPGEEGMAVAQMAHALALPFLEGFVGGGFRRWRVAVENRQLLARAGQRQRGPEAGNSAAHNENPLTHRNLLKSCPEEGMTRN